MKENFNKLIGKKRLLIYLILFLTIIQFKASAQSFLPVYQKGSGTFEEVVTFGIDAEEEDYMIVLPSKFVTDKEGNLFILDSRDNNIKKFDKEGNYITTFGRKGQGPGEIQMCHQMSIDPSGNIVTHDLGNRRFSLFDNDGNFKYTIPFKEIVWNFKIGPYGKFYIEIHDSDFRGDKGGTMIKIIQFSPDLTNKIGVDSMRIKESIYITEPQFTYVPVPFHANLSWGISPSGNIVVAYSGDYTFKIYSPEVKLIKEFHHKGKQIKVTDKDKENHFAGMVTTTTGGGSTRGAPDYIRKNTEFPKYKPFFMGIKIDHEGYILASTYDYDEKNNYYDVFTKDGKFVNHVKLPLKYFTTTYHDGYVFCMEQTEDFEYYVVKSRIK